MEGVEVLLSLDIPLRFVPVVRCCSSSFKFNLLDAYIQGCILLYHHHRRRHHQESCRDNEPLHAAKPPVLASSQQHPGPCNSTRPRDGDGDSSGSSDSSDRGADEHASSIAARIVRALSIEPAGRADLLGTQGLVDGGDNRQRDAPVAVRQVSRWHPADDGHRV